MFLLEHHNFTEETAGKTASDRVRCTLGAKVSTNSWLFPPLTREVQFDETWNVVAKKEKNCDPGDSGDADKGDDWDHTAVDPESGLLLVVIPGARSAENGKRAVEEVHGRTDGRGSMLLTSDGY